MEKTLTISPFEAHCLYEGLVEIKEFLDPRFSPYVETWLVAFFPLECAYKRKELLGEDFHNLVAFPASSDLDLFEYAVTVILQKGLKPVRARASCREGCTCTQAPILECGHGANEHEHALREFLLNYRKSEMISVVSQENKERRVASELLDLKAQIEKEDAQLVQELTDSGMSREEAKKIIASMHAGTIEDARKALYIKIDEAYSVL